jgi:hypothetical protein
MTQKKKSVGNRAAMFADVTKLAEMRHWTMLDGAAPAGFCSVANPTMVSSNMEGGYFCPATLNGTTAYRYVQGDGPSFKQFFGPNEKSKSAQYCSNIPGVGVVCSNYVPCGSSFKPSDLTAMTGNSCGCVGYKYCVNGVGSNTA